MKVICGAKHRRITDIAGDIVVSGSVPIAFE